VILLIFDLLTDNVVWRAASKYGISKHVWITPVLYFIQNMKYNYIPAQHDIHCVRNLSFFVRAKTRANLRSIFVTFWSLQLQYYNYTQWYYYFKKILKGQYVKIGLVEPQTLKKYMFWELWRKISHSFSRMSSIVGMKMWYMYQILQFSNKTF